MEPVQETANLVEKGYLDYKDNNFSSAAQLPLLVMIFGYQVQFRC